MNTLTIKTVDLINICNAAKSFKEKVFIFYYGKLYSVNDNYIKYTSHVNTEFDIPCMFVYRELSAFIKTITIETELRGVGDGELYTFTANTGIEMKVRVPNKHFMDNFNYRINNFFNLVSHYDVNEYGDITEELQELFNMKKVDGSMLYNKDGYIMTLIYGSLPLNKSDKVSLAIYNMGTTFVARFNVIKKNTTITTFIRYIRIYE